MMLDITPQCTGGARLRRPGYIGVMRPALGVGGPYALRIADYRPRRARVVGHSSTYQAFARAGRRRSVTCVRDKGLTHAGRLLRCFEMQDDTDMRQRRRMPSGVHSRRATTLSVHVHARRTRLFQDAGDTNPSERPRVPWGEPYIVQWRISNFRTCTPPPTSSESGIHRRYKTPTYGQRRRGLLACRRPTHHLHRACLPFRHLT
ncbi:hypothetical protein B0H10DRAFT_2065333 [Mycena sp. CBHHK59/15]|nr:hypothetical protein B0H10DRAFT_2065333 [Mycena sp. CBHHK59/15]